MSVSSHIPAAVNAPMQGRASANQNHGAGITLPAVPVNGLHAPVQLKKDHAQRVIDSAGLGFTATGENVFRYVNDTSNPYATRRDLLVAWNRGQLAVNQVPTPPDMLPSAAGTAAESDRLTRADSVADFGRAQLPYDFSGRQTQPVGTKSSTATTDVPVVSSVTEAIRYVRAFGSGSHPIRTGPQFILQLGPHRGLFEARRENDLVYIPLHSSAATLMRAGDIFDWSTHAKALKAAFSDLAAVKKAIQATLNGELIPESELIMSTVGAMICDAKTSITGFLDYLQTFGASAETDPTRMFSSRPEDKAVWAPSMIGGRRLPAARREEVMERGYMPDESQQTVLRQRGLRPQWVEPDGLCIFGALGTVVGAPAREVLERVLGILRSGSYSEALQAAIDNAASSGITLDQIIACIAHNDWAQPGAGDVVLEIAAVALGVSISVLLPGGAIVDINGGGKMLIKVVHPLEHFHSTF